MSIRYWFYKDDKICAWFHLIAAFAGENICQKTSYMRIIIMLFSL